MTSEKGCKHSMRKEQQRGFCRRQGGSFYSFSLSFLPTHTLGTQRRRGENSPTFLIGLPEALLCATQHKGSLHGTG